MRKSFVCFPVFALLCIGAATAAHADPVALFTEPGNGGGGSGNDTGSGGGTGSGSGSGGGSTSTAPPNAAPGDFVVYFTLVATLADGEKIQGILPFDTGSPDEFVQEAQVFASAPVYGATYTESYGPIESESCIAEVQACQLTLGSTLGRPDTLQLVYTGGPYNGLMLQTDSQHSELPPISNINFPGVATTDLQSGSITGSLKSFDLSPVPEPSSIALLGTGLLGVAGVVKRRFA